MTWHLITFAAGIGRGQSVQPSDSASAKSNTHYPSTWAVPYCSSLSLSLSLSLYLIGSHRHCSQTETAIAPRYPLVQLHSKAFIKKKPRPKPELGARHKARNKARHGAYVRAVALSGIVSTVSLFVCQTDCLTVCLSLCLSLCLFPCLSSNMNSIGSCLDWRTAWPQMNKCEWKCCLTRSTSLPLSISPFLLLPFPFFPIAAFVDCF